MADQLSSSGASIPLAVLKYTGRALGTLLYYLAIAVITIIKLLYIPVAFLLKPLVIVLDFILACLLAPFRLLVKFETLYIYVGIAAIVGVVIGLIVNYVYGSLSGILHLNPEPARPVSRSAKEYREAKQAKKAKLEAPLMLSGSSIPGSAPPNHVSNLSTSEGTSTGRRSKGLQDQTIMEEVSDY